MCGGFCFGFGRAPVGLQYLHFALLPTPPQPTGSSLMRAATRERTGCSPPPPAFVAHSGSRQCRLLDLKRCPRARLRPAASAKDHARPTGASAALVDPIPPHGGLPPSRRARRLRRDVVRHQGPHDFVHGGGDHVVPAPAHVRPVKVDGHAVHAVEHAAQVVHVPARGVARGIEVHCG